MDKRYSATLWGIKYVRIVETNSLRKIEFIKLLSHIIPWETVKIIDWETPNKDTIYYKRKGRA